MLTLDCDQVVELVTDYLEGALEPAVRLAFEEHLADCDDCVVYVDQIRQVARAVGDVRAEHLSESTRAGLLEAFRDFHTGRGA